MQDFFFLLFLKENDTFHLLWKLQPIFPQLFTHVGKAQSPWEQRFDIPGASFLEGSNFYKDLENVSTKGTFNLTVLHCYLGYSA